MSRGTDMSGDLDTVWQAITSIRQDVNRHSNQLVRTITRVEVIEKQQDVSARHFAQINRKLDTLLAARNREEGLKGNVDLLMREHQKREGTREFGRWQAAAVSFVISSIVGLLTIILFVSRSGATP